MYTRPVMPWGFLLLGLCLALVLPLSVRAITWNFDEDDNRQGWTAKENGGFLQYHRAPLRWEVRDGVWSISPHPFELGRIPTVEVISPLLGHDSALFDRIAIRLRVVHPDPILGLLVVSWRNETVPPESEVHPSIERSVTYTGDWQEIEIGDLHTGRSGEAGLESIVWEDELTDVRLQIVLVEGMRLGNVVQSPEEVPEAVEIDWIVLTGAGEHLQGELPPPQAATRDAGSLFSSPVFQSLEQEGLGSPIAVPGSVLGDLDGDRDLDLATVWTRDNLGRGQSAGWLYAFNDGTGRFQRPHVEHFSGPGLLPQLSGADWDGDGRMDLMLSQGANAKLLRNDAEEGWIEIAAFEQVWPLGLADAEGDGDVDVWLGAFARGEVLLVLNDGTGQFVETQSLAWNPPADGFFFFDLQLNEDGEMVQEHLSVEVELGLVHHVVDFDGDGDRDVLVGDRRRTVDFGGAVGLGVYQGLTFLVNHGEGNFEAMSWYPAVHVETYDLHFVELNGDGLLDWAFVDRGERETALVVSLGVADGGLPVEEGRYPLEGEGGSVLSGDLDGDGDTDLAVIERSSFETGGLHILLNRFSGGFTAIAEESAPFLPANFHLGLNYPNPFNPQTTIPFDLSASARVRLQVYNLLGQPVRSLVEGSLSAGAHRVGWDGRDARGQPVSAGMYLYRLEAGAWSATGKMTKVE